MLLVRTMMFPYEKHQIVTVALEHLSRSNLELEEKAQFHLSVETLSLSQVHGRFQTPVKIFL